MSEFHDGTWVCENGATSSDVSGGSIMRSPPFQTSVSTRLGLAADYGEALKLVETLSWEQKSSGEDPSDESDGGNTFFGRSCSLGALADVDAVDGSYSLHANSEESASSSCALPQSFSGIEAQRTTSIIESCIVATETERVRCFMIYGKSEDFMGGTDVDNDGDTINEQRLLRVVISHERKLLTDADVIKSTMGNADNRLDQLSSAMSGTTEDLGQNVKYPINMMSLSLGPWLGDVIIRDRSFNSILPQSKNGNALSQGFGAPPQTDKSAESGFGEWVLGVQKMAMTFKYNFDSNVRLHYDYGRSLGVHVENWPRQSTGIIYDDRMSRRIKPEDRSMYIDYDNGAYCGFVFGSVYVKVRSEC